MSSPSRHRSVSPSPRRSILKAPSVSPRGLSPSGGLSDSSVSPHPSRSPSISPTPPVVVELVPKRVALVEPVKQTQSYDETADEGVALESPTIKGGTKITWVTAEQIQKTKASDQPEILVSPPDEIQEVTEVGNIMAATQPRSPYTPKKEDQNNESFWDKFGTLGRKKKVKEVNEVVTEGKHAIDSPGAPFMPNMPSDEYDLQDSEERSMIAPGSSSDPNLQRLVTVLLEWLNDVLAPHRIIVRDMEDDMYDGCVLHKLIESLTGIALSDVPDVTLSEEGQKQKLKRVLKATNQILGVGGQQQYQPKWSVESIHSKNLVAILHLLVALARHFRAPIRLPENVTIDVIIVQKRDGQLNHRMVPEKLTGTYDDLGLRQERDAFDTLIDQAPDKLQVVKKVRQVQQSLITFVNRQLNKINLEVQDLDSEFEDGCHLCLLMGLLEGYFVPLHYFYPTPRTFDEKIHNVSASFELMMDAGLSKPKARPEDIVNKDLKSTLRVLYNLFTKYKSAN